MPKVSIIIPVYNAAKYLRAALDSIFRQTIKDIQVICINDGSSDDSAAIIAEYDVELISQSNMGQGAARNRGIEHAKGEYIYFMDADDEIAEVDAFERLVEVMERDSLESLFFDAEVKRDAGVELPKERRNTQEYIRIHDYSQVYTGIDLWRKMLRNREYSVSPCLMMLRRDFIEQHSLRFPDARLFYEDNIFATRVMLNAQRVSHRAWKLYNRCFHVGSTITSKPTLRHLRGFLACYDDMRNTLKSGRWNLSMKFLFRERMANYRYQALAIIKTDPSLIDSLSTDEASILHSNRLVAPFIDIFWCWRFRGLRYMLHRVFQKVLKHD